MNELEAKSYLTKLWAANTAVHGKTAISATNVKIELDPLLAARNTNE